MWDVEQQHMFGMDVNSPLALLWAYTRCGSSFMLCFIVIAFRVGLGPTNYIKRPGLRPGDDLSDFENVGGEEQLLNRLAKKFHPHRTRSNKCDSSFHGPQSSFA